MICCTIIFNRNSKKYWILLESKMNVFLKKSRIKFDEICTLEKFLVVKKLEQMVQGKRLSVKFAQNIFYLII